MYSDLDTILYGAFISSVNPAYFKPYAKGDLGDMKDRVFISGDSWAVSPAMYTYSYAINAKKTTASNTRVISIGAIKERADKIPENIGVIEWVSRVGSLQGPSKLFSQEYILDMSIRENAPSSDPNNHLHKYTYVMARDDYIELDSLNNRKSAINGYAEDMINENKDDVDLVLE
jgi:hypothetical protein